MSQIAYAAGNQSDPARAGAAADSWPKSTAGQPEVTFSNWKRLSTELQLSDASADERGDAVGISLLSRLEVDDGLSDSNQKRL